MSKEEQLFKKAEKIYFKRSEKRYIPAIKAFQKLLNEYQNNVDGWLMMATMQSCIDDYDGALNSYDKAIECEPSNIKSIDQKLTTLSLLSHMKYSEPYFIDVYKNRRYRISSVPNPIELAKLHISAIDHKLNLLSDGDYKLIIDKAESLLKLRRTEDSISEYKKALNMIPEKNRTGFLNPVNSIHMSLSEIYFDEQKYDLALNHFEQSKENKEPDYAQLYKAEILAASGQEELAKSTIYEFINWLDKILAEKPETAYFNQKIGALLKLKDFEGAKAVISEFDVLKPFNDYTRKNINREKNEIKSAEEVHFNPQFANKFENSNHRVLEADEIQTILVKDQWANELISWYYEMGDTHTDEKLLTGIDKVVEAMKKLPEFPIAEYNNLRDVTDLLGICYGEMLRSKFDWKWYYINEPEKGSVGYIIVSPDNKLAVLIEEYFYIRVLNENDGDHNALYNKLKDGVSFNWPEEKFKILGNWKSSLSYSHL